MAKKRLDWKLLVVVLIGLGVLGATAFGVRKWQRQRRASEGLRLGTQAYQEGRWQEAAAQLGRHLAANPDDVDVLLQYAQAQLNSRPLEQGNVGQAIAAYRNILREDKGNAEAAGQAARLHLQMRAAGEAELIVRRALEANDTPEVRRWLAVALIQQDKYEEAATELQQIISQHPHDLEAYETLGQLAARQPEASAASAENWFNEAVENNPSSARAHLDRAAFYVTQRDTAKATADLEQAETKDLSDPEVKLRLARLLLAVEQEDKARRLLGEIKAADPDNLALWQTLTLVAMSADSPDEVATTTESALEALTTPQRWDFLPTAVELLIRSGRLELAGKCIEEIREQDALPAKVALWEGLIARQRGENRQAIEHLTLALQLGDKSPRTRMNLAEALSSSGDQQSALGHLRALVAEFPRHLESRLGLAKLLARIGNYPEAEEQARLALGIAPTSREANMLHLQARLHQLRRQRVAQDSPALQALEERLADIAKKSEGDADIKMLQFSLALHRQDFDRASQLLQELQQDHPSSLTLSMAQVDLLQAQGKIAPAKAKLAETTAAFPDSTVPIMALAAVHASENDRKECEKLLTEAVGTFAGSADRRDLAVRLAGMYRLWDRQDDAYELLKDLATELIDDIIVRRELLTFDQVRQGPQQAQQLIDEIKAIEGADGWQWRYEQAKYWHGADDFQARYAEIVALLKENLARNPADLASQLLLGSAYDRAGELQLAASAAREALSQAPHDGAIMVAAISALNKIGEFEQADEILDRAVQQKIQHPNLREFMLHRDYRRGDMADAEKILQEQIDVDPNDVARQLMLAHVKLRQGKLDQATDLLTRLRASNPGLLAPALALVEVNLRQDKTEDALKLCDEIVGEFDNMEAYRIRARTCAALGRTERAEADLIRAAELAPDNIGIWVTQCDFYRDLGRSKDALTAIEKALSLAPTDPEVQKRTTALLIGSGDPDLVARGKSLLEEAVLLNPQDVDLRFQKANVLLMTGTRPATAEATAILQEVVEDEPLATQAWLRLGQLAYEQRQFRKAVDLAFQGLVHSRQNKDLLMLKGRSEAALSPALAIGTFQVLREAYPEDVGIGLYLADLFLTSGEPASAAALLQKMLDSGVPDDQKDRINVALAIASHRQGRGAEALAALKAMQQSDPDNPRPVLGQINLLTEEQRWSDIVELARTWHRAHPDDTVLLYTVAERLLRGNDPDAGEAAENVLRAILQANPQDARALQILAMLLQSTGRLEEAAASYQQILELQPDNAIAINNLAWICCENQKQYQRALDLAERGLAQAPDYLDLIDTRGVAYYRLGRLEESVADFTKCIELYPETSPGLTGSCFHLGRSLAQLGKKAEALKKLEQALALNEKVGGVSAAEVVEIQRLIQELSLGG